MLRACGWNAYFGPGANSIGFSVIFFLFLTNTLHFVIENCRCVSEVKLSVQTIFNMMFIFRDIDKSMIHDPIRTYILISEIMKYLRPCLLYSNLFSTKFEANRFTYILST